MKALPQIRSVLADGDRELLRDLLGERVRFDEALAPYTSWKVGGPADALASVTGDAELAAIMRLVLRRKLPWFVLGSGSNLLVGDGGIRGIVIRLGGSYTAVEVA
ncbi:MAG: FAD-binding protein, partial [Candidatus Eremiobacteraeota bacterium]|nr:FAD-binding protein [Candidatus Eremiobacteraeota bacterium]